MERLQNGDSVLDEYGAFDRVEFLAVAMESFFERPVALREKHRLLYELLASYLSQDPATWDEKHRELPDRAPDPNLARRLIPGNFEWSSGIAI